MTDVSADPDYVLAVELADQIERLFVGKSAAACIYATGLVLASAYADAERPDLNGLMRILRRTIIAEAPNRKLLPPPSN